MLLPSQQSSVSLRRENVGIGDKNQHRFNHLMKFTDAIDGPTAARRAGTGTARTNR
jgi:hypothetical protein